MKELNVLEAKNLCVNGNPVERPVFSDSEVYRNVCLFQPDSQGDVYMKTRFDNEYGAISKMTESKRYKPIPTDMDSSFFDEVNRTKEEISRVTWPLTASNVKKKAISKDSWFIKLKKWLKYWLTPMESYDTIIESYRNSREFNDAINKLSDGLKFPGHRNPPKPPLSPGEITKNKECEELASTTPFTKHQFLNAYNLFLPIVEHCKIKNVLADISYRCIRQDENFNDAVNENLSVINGFADYSKGRQNDIDRINRDAKVHPIITVMDILDKSAKMENKYLKRLRRRRKKRYSISTPITKAIWQT